MKCPKCLNPRVRYITPRKEKGVREDFNAKCSKCNFEGEIKTALDEKMIADYSTPEETKSVW